MSDEPTTPPASATPASGTPATGTPTSTGATPKIEELQARIAELERHSTNKTEEAARHGKNLSEAQKKLAAYEEKERLAQEATLSEIDKSKKEVERVASEKAAVEQQVQQLRQQLIMAEVKLAAKSMDFLNPEIAAKVIELEYDENGLPTNITKALEDLAKTNPFLLKPKDQLPPPETTPAQTANQQRPPATPAMNPGRQNISSPTTPNRIPRLSDPGVFVQPGTQQ